MKEKMFFVSILLGFLLIVNSASAAETDVTVWVEASLGIEVIPENNPVTCYKGEECGTWITIINNANIRDKIKLNASQNPKEPHLFYDFQCAETVGICKNQKVDNMILTPSMNKTKVYLSIMPMASSDVINNKNITVVGWSQTRYIYQNFTNIKVNMESKSFIWHPLETPGLQTISLILLFICSSIIFTTLKYKN